MFRSKFGGQIRQTVQVSLLSAGPAHGSHLFWPSSKLPAPGGSLFRRKAQNHGPRTNHLPRSMPNYERVPS